MKTANYIIDEIKQLRPANRLWRVDWIGGDIQKNTEVESEPTIKILMGLIKENFQGDLSSIEAIQEQGWRIVSLGVGQIVHLACGTLWKNGQLVQTKTGEETSLAIDTTQAKLFRATDKVLGQTIITYKDHRTSGFGKDSWCVCLPVGDDPAGIIIPTTEVIRFYFATSTLLSKAVYTGEITHNINKFVNLNICGQKSENYFVVHRRKIVTDDECWTLGRILNDKQANQAVDPRQYRGQQIPLNS